MQLEQRDELIATLHTRVSLLSQRIKQLVSVSTQRKYPRVLDFSLYSLFLIKAAVEQRVRQAESEKRFKEMSASCEREVLKETAVAFNLKNDNALRNIVRTVGFYLGRTPARYYQDADATISCNATVRASFSAGDCSFAEASQSIIK